MIKYLGFIILFLNILGCGRGPHYMEPDVAPIINKFLSDVIKYGRDDIDKTVEDIDVVKIAKFEEPTRIATCTWYDTVGLRRITISLEYWNIFTDQDKESLIYHELGHCFLGQMHRGQYDPILKRNTSLMYYHFTSGAKYYQFRDYYLTELFGFRE